MTETDAFVVRAKSPDNEPEIDIVPVSESRHDEDDRLKSEYVSAVRDAVEAGNIERARELVAPLHPADVADLIELTPSDERPDMVAALGDLVGAEVYSELNEYVRDDVIEEMAPAQVAEIASELDTDDAVAIIEDMEEEDQQAVLEAMEPEDRAAIESALSFPEELSRPSDAARSGRGAAALVGGAGDRLSARQQRTD